MSTARILHPATLQAVLNLEHTARRMDLPLSAVYMAETECESVHYSRAWRTPYRSASYAATLESLPTLE